MEINLNINLNNKKLRVDFVMLAILLFSAILRFYHLGFQSAWLDEVNTFIVTDPQFSMKVMHDKIMAVEGTPHLFFLLVKMLCILFGHTVYVIRLLSAVAGVLSVYYIFLVAARLFSKNAGYIAALLLSVSFFHIEYSQEARAYSLLVFFIIFSYHRLLLFIDNNTYKNAIVLGIFVGLIPNAHVFGLLNAGSIYLTLGVVFLMAKSKAEKMLLFKQIALAGVISLVVFLPVVQIIERLSQTQSHWIPAASLSGIKWVFTDLLGKSETMSVIFIVLALICFIGLAMLLVSKKQDSESKSKWKLSAIILLIWFVLNIATIIIKSYTGDASLILTRYFIGVLPAFILAAAFVLSLIPNKIVRLSAVGILVAFSLYNLIVDKNYYNTVNKAQYDKLTAEIIRLNPDNHKIVSSYGWVLNYYFDKSTSTNIIPSTFHEFINAMKIESVSMKSFWYFDGNSRPYDLNQDEQRFLDEHFIMDQNLIYFDTWARHYTSRKEQKTEQVAVNSNEIKIFMEDFTPHNLNDKGELLFFENSSVTSKEITLQPAKYEMTITGFSMPAEPINGQNAHIKVKLNGAMIGQFYLSENQKGTENKFSFRSDRTQKVQIVLDFDNDILAGGKDRNAVITGLIIKKE